MEQIRPLHEDHINHFIGMPVVLVLNNGERHIGVLTECSESRVYLNGAEEYFPRNDTSIQTSENEELEFPSRKRKRKKNKSPKNAALHSAKVKAYPQAFPFSPGYPYGRAGKNNPVSISGEAALKDKTRQEVKIRPIIHPGWVMDFGDPYEHGPKIRVELNSVAMMLLIP